MAISAMQISWWSSLSTAIISVQINQQVDTLASTWSMVIGEDLTLTGDELVDIGIMYGATGSVTIIKGGTVSSYSKSILEAGVEFTINGRSAVSKIIDLAPPKDYIYNSIWDADPLGSWESSGCGVRRVTPIPPGIDPEQDKSTYEYFEAKYKMHELLKIACEKAGVDLVTNLPDYKFRGVFKIAMAQSYFNSIKQLTSQWDPYYFMQGTTLYIIDKDLIPPVNTGISYGPDSCTVISHNFSKLDIINRLWVKGGIIEGYVAPAPILKYTQRIDTMFGMFTDSEALALMCQEITTDETAVSWAGFNFTGSRVTSGYYTPLFGQPMLIYTRETTYKDNVPETVGVTLFKYKMQEGSNNGIMCVGGFGKRRQQWINPDAIGGWSGNISKGYMGEDIGFGTGESASLYSTISVSSLSPPGGWHKTLDEDETIDHSVSNTDQAIGVIYNYGVAGYSSSSDALTKVSHMALGGAQYIKAAVNNKLNIEYKLHRAQEVYTRTLPGGVARTEITYLCTSANKASEVVVESRTSVSPVNRVAFTPSSTNNATNTFSKYYENKPSIAKYGLRPTVTYYDPSITDDNLGRLYSNKVFIRSASLQEDVTIRPLLINALCQVGGVLTIESAAYNQVDVSTSISKVVTITGGRYIVLGYRYAYDSNGSNSEISLRKVK